jgi:hypothetical protein
VSGGPGYAISGRGDSEIRVSEVPGKPTHQPEADAGSYAASPDARLHAMAGSGRLEFDRALRAARGNRRSWLVVGLPTNVCESPDPAAELVTTNIEVHVQTRVIPCPVHLDGIRIDECPRRAAATAPPREGNGGPHRIHAMSGLHSRHSGGNSIQTNDHRRIPIARPGAGPRAERELMAARHAAGVLLCREGTTTGHEHQRGCNQSVHGCGRERCKRSAVRAPGVHQTPDDANRMAPQCPMNVSVRR